MRKHQIILRFRAFIVKIDLASVRDRDIVVVDGKIGRGFQVEILLVRGRQKELRAAAVSGSAVFVFRICRDHASRKSKGAKYPHP